MDRNLDIGRPTQFGRPTFGDNDGDMHVQKTQTEDGLPMGFGRPTHRTSETRRTSDMQIFVLFNIGEAATSRRGVVKSGSRVARRKSDGLRTSDTSDVRHRTDVRNCLRAEVSGHGPCIPSFIS